MVTPQAIRRQIGRRVRDIRVRLEITQVELAGRLHLEEPTIRAIESGRRGLSLGSLFKLARELGVTPGELLDTEQELPRGVGREAARLVDSLSPRWQKSALRLLRELQSLAAASPRSS